MVKSLPSPSTLILSGKAKEAGNRYGTGNGATYGHGITNGTGAAYGETYIYPSKEVILPEKGASVDDKDRRQFRVSESILGTKQQSSANNLTEADPPPKTSKDGAVTSRNPLDIRPSERPGLGLRAKITKSLTDTFVNETGLQVHGRRTSGVRDQHRKAFEHLGVQFTKSAPNSKGTVIMQSNLDNLDSKVSKESKFPSKESLVTTGGVSNKSSSTHGSGGYADDQVHTDPIKYKPSVGLQPSLLELSKPSLGPSPFSTGGEGATGPVQYWSPLYNRNRTELPAYAVPKCQHIVDRSAVGTEAPPVIELPVYGGAASIEEIRRQDLELLKKSFARRAEKYQEKNPIGEIYSPLANNLVMNKLLNASQKAVSNFEKKAPELLSKAPEQASLMATQASHSLLQTGLYLKDLYTDIFGGKREGEKESVKDEGYVQDHVKNATVKKNRFGNCATNKVGATSSKDLFPQTKMGNETSPSHMMGNADRHDVRAYSAGPRTFNDRRNVRAYSAGPRTFNAINNRVLKYPFSTIITALPGDNTLPPSIPATRPPTVPPSPSNFSSRNGLPKNISSIAGSAHSEFIKQNLLAFYSPDDRIMFRDMDRQVQKTRWYSPGSLYHSTGNVSRSSLSRGTSKTTSKTDRISNLSSRVEPYDTPKLEHKDIEPSKIELSPLDLRPLQSSPLQRDHSDYETLIGVMTPVSVRTSPVNANYNSLHSSSEAQDLFRKHPADISTYISTPTDGFANSTKDNHGMYPSAPSRMVNQHALQMVSQQTVCQTGGQLNHQTQTQKIERQTQNLVKDTSQKKVDSMRRHSLDPTKRQQKAMKTQQVITKQHYLHRLDSMMGKLQQMRLEQVQSLAGTNHSSNAPMGKRRPPRPAGDTLSLAGDTLSTAEKSPCEKSPVGNSPESPVGNSPAMLMNPVGNSVFHTGEKSPATDEKSFKVAKKASEKSPKARQEKTPNSEKSATVGNGKSHGVDIFTTKRDVEGNGSHIEGSEPNPYMLRAFSGTQQNSLLKNCSLASFKPHKRTFADFQVDNFRSDATRAPAVEAVAASTYNKGGKDQCLLGEQLKDHQYLRRGYLLGEQYWREQGFTEQCDGAERSRSLSPPPREYHTELCAPRKLSPKIAFHNGRMVYTSRAFQKRKISPIRPANERLFGSQRVPRMTIIDQGMSCQLQRTLTAIERNFSATDERRALIAQVKLDEMERMNEQMAMQTRNTVANAQHPNAQHPMSTRNTVVRGNKKAEMLLKISQVEKLLNTEEKSKSDLNARLKDTNDSSNFENSPFKYRPHISPYVKKWSSQEKRQKTICANTSRFDKLVDMPDQLEKSNNTTSHTILMET